MAGDLGGSGLSCFCCFFYGLLNKGFLRGGVSCLVAFFFGKVDIVRK